MKHMILELFIKLWYRLSSYLFTIIQMCDPHSISRLFTDAKKILLYSQQDKSFAGFKGLVRALRKLQRNTEGTSLLKHPAIQLGIVSRVHS